MYYFKGLFEKNDYFYFVILLLNMSFNQTTFEEEVISDYYANDSTIETIFENHYNRVLGSNTREKNDEILQALIGADNISEIKLYDYLFFKIEDIINDNYESDADTEDESD